MSEATWINVTRASPCQVCKKPDFCRESSDGKVALCRRVAEGAYKSANDKNGTRYYLHRLTDDRPPHIDLPPSANGNARRADADVLHRVYDALLGGLALSAVHREQLHKRGLPDRDIDRRRYRTLPVQGRARLARELAERFGAETLWTVPGFVAKDKDGRKYLTIAGAAGLLIPVRDLAGRIAALKVRRDDAGDGPRYSYLSSVKCGGCGPGSPVHVPLGVAASAAMVRATEGELKADVATALTSVPTIGLPGVGAWPSARPLLREMETKTVRIAYDADAADNPTVARALAACADGLDAEGFTVEVERWGAEYKGIDDALVFGAEVVVLQSDAARAYVAEAAAKAKAGEPMAPKPLDRLDDVLTGGAEALFSDKALLERLAALAESDPAEFQCVRARVKNVGVGLRALDSALAPSRQKIRAEKPPLTSAGEYKVSGGRIVHVRPTKDGPVESPLCNFAARIVAQTTVDDGVEQSIRLAIEGTLSDGMPLPTTEVRAEDFARMEWTIRSWGSKAVVFAGAGTRDHLRAALQLLSGDVPARVVYGHLGWRKIGEQWVYLHAGGAIDADGPVDGIEVAPPDALARYQLPAPPAGDDLSRAVRASLALLDCGPPRLTFPLLAAVYRAALGSCDFALHLMGQTGVFKSELAALCQQHGGAAMDARHLPASWSSTGNSLEGIAFAAKDTLLVVDDFAPSGSVTDVARLHREAERLFRAQGNASGRQRMRADGTLRPAKPPRGLVLSTGEDAPRGQSLRARLFTIEIGRGDSDAAALTRAQRDAADGLYAASMAGFIRWLAPQYDAVHGRLSAERAELRDCAAGDGQHARAPAIVADLALGLRYLLAFAVEAGVIDAACRFQLWERGWMAIAEAGAAQSDHIDAAEPTGHFLRLLGGALASGRAHLAATDGQYPEAPSAWGWRREDGRDGPTWREQGRCVGWVDGYAVLLEPEASYAAAQGMANEQGESLTVSARTLWKRLRERGLLARWDERRQRLTIRRTLEGSKDREVLHLQATALYPIREPTEPSADAANLAIAEGMRTVPADGSADGRMVF